MIKWKPIKTAPVDRLILVGTESDPTVDTHMFFIGLACHEGKGKCWNVCKEDVCFPSHWAEINSPIKTALVTYHDAGKYYVND